MPRRLSVCLLLAFAVLGCPPATDLDGDGHLAYDDGGDDCDDDDPRVFIGAIEACDGVDNDCNGLVDEAEEIPYDGIDNDCVDGDADDLDGDGWVGAEAGGPDCADDDPQTHPGWQLPDPAGLLDTPSTADIVDGIDNDCDGLIDEGPFAATFVDAIEPIFLGSCSANQCHAAPAGQAGLSLSEDAFSELVSVPSTQSDLERVAPFDPLGSYLWHKLNGTQLDVGGVGISMPFDQPLLPEETRELVYLWLLEGAPRG